MRPICVNIVFAKNMLGKRIHRCFLKILFCVCFAAFFLIGCTGRELEDRRFPLVLEAGMREGELVFSCAWPDDGYGSNEDAGDDTEGEGGQEMERGTEQGEEQEIERAAGQGEEQETDWETNEIVPAVMNTNRITSVTAASIEDALKKIQSLQDRYVDYSHVKAVLLRPEVKWEAVLFRELTGWLEDTPEIARNILIFETDRLNLEEIQQQSQGEPGNYLEHLYKNNEAYRANVSTLQEFLYHGSACSHN